MTNTLPAICVQSADQDALTPLQFAFQVLRVAPEEQVTILEVQDPLNQTGLKPFDQGWKGGFAYELESYSLPILTPVSSFLPHITAWLVGFVAGQFAGVNDLMSPHCGIEGHQH